MVSAFGTGFSEPIQGNTPLSTDLAADSVHTLLPLPITTIASFLRIGGRGQQRVVKKRQGVCTRRREHLFEGLAHPREPLHPLPQLAQRAQRGLRAATPVKERVDVLHDVAQCTSLGQATREVPKPLAFRWRQSACDEHKAVVEYLTDFLLHRCALTRHTAGRFVCGRRSATPQRGCGRGQAGALCGHRFHDPLGQVLDDMEGAELMAHLTKDRADRFGIQRRAIGRAPLECEGAIIHRRLEAPQKDGEVVMSGIVIEDRRAHPFVLPIVDGREHTGGPLREFIGRHVARKRRKRPVQKRAVPLPLRLFFPPPPSTAAGWHRGQTRGGRATDASWRGGKGGRLRPPGVPPSGSHDEYHDCLGGLSQTD